MVNPLKGEVAFEVEGETYTLVLDFNALCALEELLDIGTIEIAKRLKGELRGGFVRAVLWAGLQRHHSKLTLYAAGDLIAQIGMVAAGRIIIDGFIKAMPAAEDGGAAADPQPATPRQRRRRGTSKGSSPTGVV